MGCGNVWDVKVCRWNRDRLKMFYSCCRLLLKMDAYKFDNEILHITKAAELPLA